MQDEKRITLRVPGHLWEWMRKVRDEEGASVNYQIVRAIKEQRKFMERANA